MNPIDASPISFFVPGLAAPGGSKRAIWRPGMKHANVVEACKRNPAWRQTVQVFAHQEYQGPPLTGALRLTARFLMPRPKCHFRTGKHAGELREDAPHWHTKKPDATKLLRAMEDALTGTLWVDDAQIAWQEVEKVYGETPGAMITVERLDPANPRVEVTIREIAPGGQGRLL